MTWYTVSGFLNTVTATEQRWRTAPHFDPCMPSRRPLHKPVINFTLLPNRRLYKLRLTRQIPQLFHCRRSAGLLCRDSRDPLDILVSLATYYIDDKGDVWKKERKSPPWWLGVVGGASNFSFKRRDYFRRWFLLQTSPCWDFVDEEVRGCVQTVEGCRGGGCSVCWGALGKLTAWLTAKETSSMRFAARVGSPFQLFLDASPFSCFEASLQGKLLTWFLRRA